MAPSTIAPKAVKIERKSTLMGATVSTSREATPTAVKPESAEMATKSDTELAGMFRSDLTDIRGLVTCSICDQLLYEPWNLACGHTYCYSCLCNWFVPNKRKKTCPDCRTKVEHMPGPNYLVKQMVEVFLKRVELMPADESVEQHNLKRMEEIAAVEQDRKAPEGLFKGTFPPPRPGLMRDDEDNVLRCPGCGHEHEGGPECVNCGLEVNSDFEDGDFSDMYNDDFDGLDDESGLEDIEADFADEIHGELARSAAQFFHRLQRPAFVQNDHDYHNHHHHHMHDPDEDSNGSGLSQDEMGMDSEDDEDEGSLQDFVINDEEPPRGFGQMGESRPRSGANIDIGNHQAITISDDESDEGGVISNRRPRRRGFPESTPIDLLTDTSVDGSEAGDEDLRVAGWSPLDQGNDSDTDGQMQFGYEGYTGDEQSDDDSDTNTATAGNEYSDDEGEDERRESATPTYRGLPEDDPDGHMFHDDDEYLRNRIASPLDTPVTDIYPYDVRDRDGDSEMTPSTRSVSVATSVSNHYAGNQGSSRGVSVSTDYDGNSDSSIMLRNASRRRPESVDFDDGYGMVEDHGAHEELGTANEVHEIEDESSDESPRPPPRRLPRRYHPNPRVQQYDPRISMMFADYMRENTNQPSGFSGFSAAQWAANEVPRVTPASRVRELNAYRILSPRARSSRSPSANRVLSVAGRSSRHPRQYFRH